MPDPAEWSELEVALVQGRSRLVASKSLQPLKILNPRAGGTGCHAVLSSYGGGLVAGDRLRLNVRCQPGARLFLSTQANTKVFKSIDGRVAEQHVSGHLAAGALAAVLPDPVVPQAGSRYRQRQHWDLAPEALLLLADWWAAGRTELGERFAFQEFASETRISVASQPLVLDRFAFDPAEHIATAPANFDRYESMLTVYLVGAPGDPRFAALAGALHALKMPVAGNPHFRLAGRACVVAVAQARPGVLLLRALAASRADVEFIYQHLLGVLAGAAFFGADMLARKY
ncbi:urease accessory protein UreD [Hymenobacter caeli]|uniref:Urease accessory protein UreD n=1 Tax=Hymenobacter caeli TaxID=2735894 RepID=A0ABX2FTI2_9BACT|nr:urease accessory protein UreD [Hymenobacter caeli]NRT20500.1 urease accessory protein [Hymenobacter caeli]